MAAIMYWLCWGLPPYIAGMLISGSLESLSCFTYLFCGALSGICLAGILLSSMRHQALWFFLLGLWQNAPLPQKIAKGSSIKIVSYSLFPALDRLAVANTKVDGRRFLVEQTCFVATGISSIRPNRLPRVGNRQNCGLLAMGDQHRQEIVGLITTRASKTTLKWLVLLLGDKTGFSEQETFLLSQLGLGHIFAVSGIHIAIVIGLLRVTSILRTLLYVLFARGERVAVWLRLIETLLLAFTLTWYSVMVGLPGSVVRTVMAWTLGRLIYHLCPSFPGNGRCTICILICIYAAGPNVQSISFLLSIICFAILGMSYVPRAGLLWRMILPCLRQAMLSLVAIALLDFRTDLASWLANLLFGMLFSPLIVLSLCVGVLGGSEVEGAMSKINYWIFEFFAQLYGSPSAFDIFIE